MRNKGAIWTFGIALMLVCIYQLSFTIVTYKVRSDAKKYALQFSKDENGELDSLGLKIKDRYLDSISTEEVYNFAWLKKYTYRECQEREINLGLDLRGGMNVVLEVSTVDVVRSLANYSKDTTFNKAIVMAREMQKSSTDDFVTLFGKAFETINPDAKLGAIFTAPELRDVISYNSTNKDVLEIIHQRTSEAISNSFQIISTRIDHFGVASANVQRIQGGDRILVELPGVEEKDRVRKLLQGTARLEFWETYENSEIVKNLVEANTLIKNINKSALAASQPSKTTESGTAVTSGDTTQQKKEDLTLLEQIESDTTSKSDSLAQQSMMEEMPLFAVLTPNVSQNWEPFPGSAFGRARIKDTARVNQYMKLAMERGIFPTDFKYLWTAKPMADPTTKKSTDIFEVHAIKVTGREGKPPLIGDVVTQADMQFDQNSGSAEVSMSMDAAGTTTWARITRENVGKCIAIVMDDYVYSSPRVNEEIPTGNSSITGDFDAKEATDLANLLKSGTLPAPAKIIQEEVIGPSLGKEYIRSGMGSLTIAFIGIFIFMVFYYSRKAGLIADIALFLNLFFLIGVLASLGMALTLPGIAGIVLTIGMSVDANVLIYERVREEVLAGKGTRLAVSDGFKNAMSAIIDGNVTTLLTGIILYVLGTGPVKGFATTLVIGICTSMFAALFITRLVFEIYMDKNINLTFSTKATSGALKNIHFDYMKNRKIFYAISAGMIIFGIISLVTRGLDQGVDFTGGRNFIVKFENPVSNVEVAKALEKTLGTRPTVITFGAADKVRITTKYGIDSEDPTISDQIQKLLYDGLKPMLGNNVSYDKFATNYIQSIQLVGPTIAVDIRRKSYIAIFFSLIIMFLYIGFRFKSWRFGMGAMASLAHDAFFVIAMFSILYGIMPFSMEIDQTFIAAILTIIGYSVNDTVVIFDRIREHRKLHPKKELASLINDAINDTMSRTIITSLTVLITVAIIFFYTGESVMGFAFAMFIGLVSGIYSTVFIATALVYDTTKRHEAKKGIKG